MNEQHTYAGHTLAEIKAAAEAAAADDGISILHVVTFNPATVLAMAARIEGLEIRIGTGNEYRRMAEEHLALANRLNARIEDLEREADDLRTTMIAAAEEIHEHWDAHCGEEGYGPANLMTRLERGVSAGYPGYNAGQFTRADQRIAELEAELHRANADSFSALRLVAEVRHACGDDGKRMQDELVQYVGELAKDAARYRQLRRGQRWGVIDGIGKSLRADELDAAIDRAMEQTKTREGA